jgi:flagellar assembly factor FliW
MTYRTAHLGLITVDETSTIDFPEGLPGFEECRRFVPLQLPAHAGLVFLQSLERADLCFLALPVKAIRPDYEVSLCSEDLDLLGFPEDFQPAIGTDIVALAILSLVDGEMPTANLFSPVVIDIRTRRAVQAVRPDRRYGCREAVVEEVLCS